ncbi:hypothetical protein B9Z55_002837 [Caenorhabditis nigoni]|nr:hypothetical protein B9Z55_002837 [Caenorhabditis nigoni]
MRYIDKGGVAVAKLMAEDQTFDPQPSIRIQFSLLSKRSKTIAKRIRWNPIDIRFNPANMLLNQVDIRWNPIEIRRYPIYIRWLFGTEQEIRLKLSTDPGLEYIIHYRKKKKFIPIHCPWKYPYFQSYLLGPNALHVLCLKDNGIEDMTQMMEHICEVFRSPICEMHIIEESLIEWIIKFQPIIQHVCIRENAITSVESLDRILKNLKVTERFWSNYNACFQYKEPIPSRCITIDNSYWLTLNSILNGNNSIIFLYDSKLTPTDINTILKEWQLGFKLRNLEFMAIEVFTLLNIHRYSDEVLNNLPNIVENNGRPMTVTIHDDDIYTLPQGPPVHNITRSDGMILSIFRHDDVIEGDKIRIFWELQVWRQQT